MHRVHKLLSNYGYCSRRKAEQLIKDGRVKVNGQVISIGDKAAEGDEIRVDNKLVKKPEKIYIMLNKPKGFVTAVSDKHEKTVMELIKEKERVYPAGRLDKNTRGLLILTNDGDFANKLMHPSHEIEKTYFVMVDKTITNETIDKLKSGVKLEDGRTRPAYVEKIGDRKVNIAIHEGKNRIVRRMFEKLHYRVIDLQRTKIGNLELCNLQEGKYRKIKKEEL